ncbi:MFS transporter [Pseudomonas sp. CBSPBW29]|uniref:MFS transporter n=1 Tax=Pseudomonas sp. CBS TaxID=2971912 RepID=UPI0021ACFD76|nr:MFS transporter [Pseudomonas sp. CBS]WEL43631.1 MFS transporter [Pseudomonas sp. CBSPBW29]WEL64698.1 MFS transporter [Pseudomonas sp. CBSPGW29]WEL68164.1 MFS transporter [Pseudomonas sp. CBSPCGW29]WEL75183.1 MFS transporter [Pseudomonas sp. CBSPAW29]WEL80571.1 MFS transporter [Pseudomonas sp. CBSPCAW29]WEL89086.1 MFS transporter [Pseudomonas sp. CBSPCBW29]
MVNSALRTWCAVGALCVASFTMVTSEFAPIGLLSQISSDLGQTPSTVGLAVTLYAWIGAASGLLSNWLNRWIPRKTLLIALMLLLAVSNGLAALSPDFPTLLGSRAVGALAHGVFWAIVAATAAHIVPPYRMGLATSIVLGGITIATVMGVPLINMVGQYDGWRTAFACLALMCGASAGAIAVVLPSVQIHSLAKGVGFVAVLRRKDLLITYVITGLTAAAHFGAYTFVEPFIGQVPGITAYLIAVLLFAFGAAGFLGNLLSALFIDRHLSAFILAALIAMALALVTLGIYGPLLGIAPVVILLVIWGVAISALFTGLQTWVLRIAGDHTVPATAIHTAVLNSAIGLGVIIGGEALNLAGFKGAMLSASLVIAPAIVLMISAGVRAWTEPAFLKRGARVD